MTREVVVTHMEEQIDALFAVMTQQRIRHLPVMEVDRLAGLVSIGGYPWISRAGQCCKALQPLSAITQADAQAAAPMHSEPK